MDFWRSFKEKSIKLARILASASVIFYTLPWLMVLVILGTISQKELGLHAASQTYFNSIILWLGPIPTPGGLTTIAIIFIALSIKFLFFSKWSKHQAGIILTHLGILLLLLGGIVTVGLSREGFMIIPEGDSVSFTSDYHQRVVSITSETKPEIVLDFSTLKKGQELSFENLGLSLKILEHCNNCSAQAPSGNYKSLKGLAKNMELIPIPSEKNIETNFSGLIFEITKASKKSDLGTYIIMEDVPKTPVFSTIQGDIEIKLERKKTPLPFSIQLQDFRKIDYQSTTKAREFESDLIIQDGDLSWPVTISMNQPLRYKGYTFYQSSFIQRPNIEVTVLSVVQNAGRAFPYISSFIIFLGILLHLIIRLQTTGKREVSS